MTGNINVDFASICNIFLMLPVGNATCLRNCQKKSSSQKPSKSMSIYSSCDITPESSLFVGFGLVLTVVDIFDILLVQDFFFAQEEGFPCAQLRIQKKALSAQEENRLFKHEED